MCGNYALRGGLATKPPPEIALYYTATRRDKKLGRIYFSVANYPEPLVEYCRPARKRTGWKWSPVWKRRYGYDGYEAKHECCVADRDRDQHRGIGEGGLHIQLASIGSRTLECVASASHPASEEQQEQRDIAAYAQPFGSLGMFGAVLLQELTEPVSVIQLALQNALAESVKSNCPGAIRRDLQTALDASATIATVIRNSRGVAGWLPKTVETDVYVHLVAERVFRMLEQSARQARIHLRTENLEALPAIRMRENDCEQLLFALTQNAVQAADGSADRCLAITGARQDGRITLQFQDDCGGIDPICLQGIFDPFAAAKSAGKGTRLGLCIAHRIVRQRGGRISVQNRYGEGTTFTVILPVRRI